MDRSIYRQYVDPVRGLGVSVFGLPPGQARVPHYYVSIRVRLDFKFARCVGGPIRLSSRAKDELLLKFWLTKQFLFY